MWARSMASARAPPTLRLMTLVLNDESSSFDTLATWERHLADVRRLPDDVALITLTAL
jgi:hypothetical protein